MTRPPSTPEVVVPPDDPPAARCPYCDRPFRSEHLAALHVGETHPTECTNAEREAYEQARAEESDELFVYHLKVLAAVVMLLMGLSYVYAFALS